jgi:hypothetical protein
LAAEFPRSSSMIKVIFQKTISYEDMYINNIDI